MAICVLRGREIAFEGAWGFTDTTRTQPVTRESMFDIASVSKPFTAALALQEVAAGRLRLDATLGELLPGVPHGWDGVTLRHLLSQTSGVPEYMADGDPAAVARGVPIDGAWTTQWLATQKPDFAPGERWAYSNTNFKLVGAIAEQAAGRSFSDLFHERIVGTARLSRTGLTAFGPHAGPPRLFVVAGGRPRHYVHGVETPIVHDGGVVASAADLARGLAALFDGTLLPESLAVLATTPSSTAVGPVGYGLALRLGSLEGHRKFGHTGGQQSIWACATHYPDDSLTIAVLLNTDGFEGPGAATIEARVARAMLGLPEPTFDEVALTDAQRDALCGTFEQVDEGKAARYERYVENGRLMERDLQSGEAFPLRHLGGGVFGDREWGELRLVSDLAEAPARVITVMTGGLFYGTAYRVEPDTAR